MPETIYNWISGEPSPKPTTDTKAGVTPPEQKEKTITPNPEFKNAGEVLAKALKDYKMNRSASMEIPGVSDAMNEQRYRDAFNLIVEHMKAHQV